MAKNISYFPHDSNANSDEKCMYILQKHGPIAYGLYWLMVEAMHESCDGKLTCNLLDGFARFNISTEDIITNYNTMITAGLFVTDGEKYWSERVIANKIEREKRQQKTSADRSLAGKIGMAARWGEKSKPTNCNDSITQYNNDITSVNNTDNNDITKITKEKKRKEKKSKEKESKGIYKGDDIFATFSGENMELLSALNAFEEMRNKLHKPLTDRAKELCLMDLEKLSTDKETQINIINQSISHGWQSFYVLKGTGEQTQINNLKRWANNE